MTNARKKGGRGERLLANELKIVFPELADSIRRGWQSRAGGDDPDVIFPGIWFEHKFGVMPNPRAALKQAIGDSRGRGLPVAVIRDNRRSPFVVMLLSDFLPLLRKSMRLRDGDDSRSRRQVDGVRSTFLFKGKQMRQENAAHENEMSRVDRKHEAERVRTVLLQEKTPVRASRRVVYTFRKMAKTKRAP